KYILAPSVSPGRALRAPLRTVLTSQATLCMGRRRIDVHTIMGRRRRTVNSFSWQGVIEKIYARAGRNLFPIAVFYGEGGLWPPRVSRSILRSARECPKDYIVRDTRTPARASKSKETGLAHFTQPPECAMQWCSS